MPSSSMLFQVQRGLLTRHLQTDLQEIFYQSFAEAGFTRVSVRMDPQNPTGFLISTNEICHTAVGRTLIGELKLHLENAVPATAVNREATEMVRIDPGVGASIEAAMRRGSIPHHVGDDLWTKAGPHGPN